MTRALRAKAGSTLCGRPKPNANKYSEPINAARTTEIGSPLISA